MREKCKVCNMSIKSDDLLIPYYVYPNIGIVPTNFVHLKCCTNDAMRRIGDHNKMIREALGK